MRPGHLLAPLLLLLSCTAAAHPLAPALLQIEQISDTGYAVLWRLSAMQAGGAVPQPVFPRQCQNSKPPQVEIEAGSALAQRWQIDCGPTGLRDSPIGASNLDASGINVILRIQHLDGRQTQALLDAGQPSFRVPAQEAATAVAGRFLLLGMEHLAFGADHLLFLLGLLLLVRHARQLVITLTAFTLGHSITLSLAALGWLQVHQGLMEFGIALSLIVLAREILRPRRSALGRHPALMATGFGLLHGLGFAGALTMIGLPQTEVVPALLGFNLGIELAQLGIVAAVIGVTAPLRFIGYKWNHSIQSGMTVLPAYAIGSLAIFWCIERAGALPIALRMLA